MSKPKLRPSPVRTTDEHGTAIVRVPVDRYGHRWAILEAVDFDRLRAQGISPTWFFNRAAPTASPCQLAYVKAHATNATGRLIMVARTILEAGPGERVEYVTSDRLDLRRSNIRLTSGYAKRNDSAFCGEAVAV